MTQRSYKYRFYPTDEQRQLLARTFGSVRFVYNVILRWRTEAYDEDGESIGYARTDAKLTELKKSGEFPWLYEVSSVPLQQCLRHRHRAFRNFFEGRARYPVFKSKHRRQSVTFTKSAFSYRDGEPRIAKCSTPLDVRWSRSSPYEPSTLTIGTDASGRYFVSCPCKFEPVALPAVPRTVGVDMGLRNVEAAGLAALASGGCASPASAYAGAGSAPRKKESLSFREGSSQIIPCSL